MKAMLLHFIGTQAYNVLCDKQYADIVKVLENHYEPNPTELLECFKFNIRNKCEGRKIKKKNEYKDHVQNVAYNIRGEGKKCFRCGSASHLANQCNFKSVICHLCKQKGHIPGVCFKEKKQIHQIGEKDANNISEKIKYALMVEGVKTHFELDTGYPVSNINLDEFQICSWLVTVVFHWIVWDTFG